MNQHLKEYFKEELAVDKAFRKEIADFIGLEGTCDLHTIEGLAVRRALRITHGNAKKSCELLGVRKVVTLYHKCQKYGIHITDYK